MPNDAFTLSYLAKELQSLLKDAKVNRIVQPESDEIVLHLYAKSNYKLLLSCNAQYPRCHITEYAKDNPKDAFMFLMTLRKHLIGSTLTDVSAVKSERILKFSFLAKNELKDQEVKKLIIEIMGKHSNIILTDGEDKILGAAKSVSFDTSSVRQILTGLKYELPPAREGVHIGDENAIRKCLSEYQGGDLTEFLSKNIKGIAFSTARQMVAAANVSSGGLLSEEERERLVATLTEFDKTPPSPAIVKKEGKILDFYPFVYQNESGQRIYKETLNQAADDYFYLNDKYRRFSDKSKELHAAVKTNLSRLEKKKTALLSKLLDCEKMEEFKIKGELITSNLYKLKGGESSLTAVNYYDENQSEIVIKLDERLSPSKNAQSYYKKYAKLKSGKQHSETQLLECEEAISYLLSVEQSFAFCSEPQELLDISEELKTAGIVKSKPEGKKKTAVVKSSPFSFEVQGFTIYAGKNNLQNDRLTFEIAKPHDIWLHTKLTHGAHVILVTEGKTVPDEVLTIALEIAAYHSKAGMSGKTAVDYAFKKTVKKPSGAKPGFVIYTDYTTAMAHPNAHEEYLKK